MSCSPTDFRIRWPAAGGIDRQASAHVDTDAQTVRLDLPDGQRITAEVVTCRAIAMLIGHSAYTNLGPLGPTLDVEYQHPAGRWTPITSAHAATD